MFEIPKVLVEMDLKGSSGLSDILLLLVGHVI